MSNEEALRKTLDRWFWHPEQFDAEAFEWGEGGGPTEQQIEFFTEVGKLLRAKFKVNTGQYATDEERRYARKLGISIASGHGPGKTAVLTRLYYWMMTCCPNACGYVTASNSMQLETVMWKEFYKWREKSKLLKQLFTVQSTKVFLTENPKGSFVQARTTNIKASEEEQGETLAGLHADYMILAADEASSLPFGVFKPLRGAMTGIANFLVLISNPTRLKGYFFDTHHKDRDQWICLKWNAEESPLVSRDLLEADRLRYGKDSNWYRVRRLGEFPIADQDTLIPYEWVEAAINRDISTMPSDICLKGLDVGAGGDETALLTRKGRLVLPIITKNEPDSERLKEWLLLELLEEKDPFILFLDPIGVGNHLYYWLIRQDIPNMKQVYAVDVRQESRDRTCFRLRDELFMKMRNDFEKRTISIPFDDELVGELTTIKSDDPDSTKGKIKIESKRDLRARGLNSPNKADSLALTYYLDDKYCEHIINDNEKKKKVSQASYNWRVL